MLPQDKKKSKNYFHKKCTCFTSKKKTKVAIFKSYMTSDDQAILGKVILKNYNSKLINNL